MPLEHLGGKLPRLPAASKHSSSDHSVLPSKVPQEVNGFCVLPVIVNPWGWHHCWSRLLTQYKPKEISSKQLRRRLGSTNLPPGGSGISFAEGTLVAQKCWRLRRRNRYISESLHLPCKATSTQADVAAPNPGLCDHYESSGPTRGNTSSIYFNDLQSPLKTPPSPHSSLLKRMAGRTPNLEDLPQIAKKKKKQQTSQAQVSQITERFMSRLGRPWSWAVSNNPLHQKLFWPK